MTTPMPKISVVLGDITTICDTFFDGDYAIVNAANRRMLGGGGVDGAIHAAGGHAIYDECVQIRKTVIPDGLDVGAAVATTAGKLNAKAVIHTVGPLYQPSLDLSDLLQDCYRRSLWAADGLGIRNVAFPLISSGAYGWPKEDAVRQAITGILAAKDTKVQRVALVAYNEEIETLMSSVATEMLGWER